MSYFTVRPARRAEFSRLLPKLNLMMNSDLPVQLSELEHRYAEALTAGKDVKTLSAIWEKIRLLRSQINETYSQSSDKEAQSG
jgi:hypothetical protein